MKKYWYIVSRVTLYKLTSRGPEDFWDWLFVRVTNKASVDHARPLFVMYLLGDAIDTGEFIRAADVYDRFRAIVDQYSTPTLMEEIEIAIAVVQKRESLKTD